MECDLTDLSFLLLALFNPNTRKSTKQAFLCLTCIFSAGGRLEGVKVELIKSDGNSQKYNR